MNDKINQQEINATAWAACDTFRGVVDPAQYKDYILVFLFLKYISDLWKEHYEAYRQQYGDDEQRIRRKLERERFVLPLIELKDDEGNTVEQFIGQLGHEAGFVIVGVALVHLLAGYGLLRMRTWARLLTLLLSALELVLVIPSALHANSFSLCFGALNALCIFYLAMPPVRRCFKLPATA